MLKRLLLPALQSLAAAGILACLPGAASAFSPTHLMDDGVFDNNVTMGQPQIQAMVDGTDGKLPAPSACLRTYQTPNFFFDGTVWHYGDITTNDTTDPNYSHRWNVSYGPSMILASQAIYQSAHQWGMNPQVLIATLEKEESLVAGTSCDAWRYNSAMGYGCPDSGGCNAKYAGFSRQILWAGWQLKFSKERALGNTSWDGDGDITYVGYMTQGTFKRCASCTANYYDGGATIDGTRIVLETGTTASLYTYTPHLGQAFPGIFERWFGSVLTACGPNEVPLAQVQRLYNPKTFENFYTPYQCEVNAVISKLGFESAGAAFNISSSTLPGAVPVYRLYSPAAKSHLWTASGDDITFAVTKLGFQIDGLAFWTAPPAANGTFPVYRLYNPNTYQHFWTQSKAETVWVAQNAGYRLEGTGFFSQ
jgi:hypothetical protein